jgi:hypothetical protein
VWGTAAAATVGDDGAFTLGGLPAGTRTLEVRAIGFAPRRVPVDLAPGRADTLNVRLDRVTLLDTVTVVDRRRHYRPDRVITAEDLERWHVFEVTDALRGMARVQVAQDRRFGKRIMGRSLFGGRCPATIVLDGRDLPPGDDLDRWVGPQDVARIEVYADAAFAPPHPGDLPLDGCSVLLIWTRRTGQ